MINKKGYDVRKVVLFNEKPISDFLSDNCIIHFYDKYCIAFTWNHLSVYNQKGECLLSEDFDYVKYHVGDLQHFYEVEKDSLLGMYNYKGELILPIQFKEIISEYICFPKLHELFSAPCVFIVRDQYNNVGTYSSDGNIIIPLQYDGVKKKYDKLYEVVKFTSADCSKTGYGYHSYGYYSLDGKVIVPCEYISVDYMFNDIIFVTDISYKRGAYSATGEILVPIEFDDIRFADDARKILLCTKKYEYEYYCFSTETRTWL